MTNHQSEIQRRLEYSTQKLDRLKQELCGDTSQVRLAACVYAIGSFGRMEGSEQSDLDLFILGESEAKNGEALRKFSRLREIELKAQLIQSTRKLGFPEFSGDGEYLVHYPVTTLIGNTGAPQDDSTNTLTARLLLLLESQPILNEQLYETAIEQVLGNYWRDYETHSEQFVPAYLINDIQRMWRTFCLNYEARTSRGDDVAKAKRKLKNYKLRHSRLLTCFSGLAFLLEKFSVSGTVTPEDAREMTKKSPVQRIESLRNSQPKVKVQAIEVLERYEEFLVMTAKSEEKLFAAAQRREPPFTDPSEAALGKAMFELLWKLGEGTRFLQMIVV